CPSGKRVQDYIGSALEPRPCHVMPDEIANRKQPRQEVALPSGFPSTIAKEEKPIAGPNPAADVSPTDTPAHRRLAHLRIIALVKPHVSRLARIHVIDKQIGAGVSPTMFRVLRELSLSQASLLPLESQPRRPGPQPSRQCPP